MPDDQTTMYAWLADRIIAYRRWILFAALVAAIVFGLQVPKLGFDFTPQQMFQSTSDEHDYRETFAERFGREDNLVTVVVMGPDVFEPEVLEALRGVTLDLRRQESIKSAESIATFDIPRPGDAPGEMTLEPVLKQEAEAGQKISRRQANKLAEVALDEPLVRGRLVGEERDTALVAIWLDDDLQDADQLKGAVDQIDERLADYPLPDGYEYDVGGVPTLRTEIVEQLRDEQLTFLPLTAFLYLVLLAWLFRRASGVLLPVGVVLLAVLATISVLVWTDSSINIVNHVLPTLIFVIGIADSIHMLTRDAEEIEAGMSRTEAIKATVRHTGVACLLTSCTTAVGFVSLLAADSNILQNLGWQAAVGVLFAYAATLLFLPAALTYLRPVARAGADDGDEEQDAPSVEGRPPGGRIERTLVAGARFLLGHPKKVVAISLLIAAIFGVLATGVVIDTTLLEVFDEEHPSYATTDMVEEKLGGFLPIEISLESDEKDRFKDPEVYRKMARLQNFAEEQEAVVSTQSIVDFYQSARAALIGEADERETMPKSRAEIEQLHLLIGGAPDETDGVNKFVTSDFRNSRILVRVSDVGARAQLALADKLEDEIEALFGDDDAVRVRLTGDAYVASVALDTFIRDLFYSLLVAFGIIFLMMTAVFRSLKLGLISMLPNSIPLVITFGYMALADVNLNTTTIIIFAISLGLAVDDTIHFLARFREEFDRRTSAKEAILQAYYGAGRAILLTSVLLVLGLAVLLTSDFIPTRQFGTLTAITIGGAVFADLILLPSLLYLIYGEDE